MVYVRQDTCIYTGQLEEDVKELQYKLKNSDRLQQEAWKKGYDLGLSIGENRTSVALRGAQNALRREIAHLGRKRKAAKG